jgi:hypothetical protein
MGPIVLFDKSFIEMLNVDEAALFDFLFLTNICPIFLVEVLAALEKEKPGRAHARKSCRRRRPQDAGGPFLSERPACLDLPDRAARAPDRDGSAPGGWRGTSRAPRGQGRRFRRSKWRLMSPEAEARAKAHQAASGGGTPPRSGGRAR